MKAQIQPTIIFDRKVPGLSERKLSNFVTLACRGVSVRGAVSVLITSSRRMRALNTRFRDKNRATDVLSFPGPEFADGFAGDIAVSVDIATRNALSLRHSVADEVRILVLHGLLHLAGYDHEADQGEMAKREEVLRRRLGLPSALIERSRASDHRHRTKAGRSR